MRGSSPVSNQSISNSLISNSFTLVQLEMSALYEWGLEAHEGAGLEPNAVHKTKTFFRLAPNKNKTATRNSRTKHAPKKTKGPNMVPNKNNEQNKTIPNV